MRRKNMWAGRLTAILLCTVLSAEPIAIYAEDFSDGIANTEMQDKTEIPESTESYQNAESQVDADPESLSDEFESPEQDFESMHFHPESRMHNQKMRHLQRLCEVEPVERTLHGLCRMEY